MSVLFKEVKRIKPEAASVLEMAGFRTDLEIQSLTREDLHELFPERGNLKLRKTIFDIIHKQKPTDVLLKQLQDFIPHDSLRAALTNNGVLVDYLHILKEMKTQVENVQNFLGAHIGLLEKFTENQHQEQDNGSLADTSNPGSSGSVVSCQTEDLPPGAQGDSFTLISPQDYQEGFPYVTKVIYQKVISGKNFDVDAQLLAKVKAQDRDQVQFIESNQDSNIIIVFCTISSRVGSDVEAAMSEVKGDKPVILVLMHHSREAKSTLSKRISPQYTQVVLQVNVFFHETLPGLLKCYQNDEAAFKIQKKLLEYRIQGMKDASGNALSGATGPVTRGSMGSGGNHTFFDNFFPKVWGGNK